MFFGQEGLPFCFKENLMAIEPQEQHKTIGFVSMAAASVWVGLDRQRLLAGRVRGIGPQDVPVRVERSSRLARGRRRGVQATAAMALALLLPCKFQGGRQEVRQRSKGPAGLDEDGQKIRRAGLHFREVGERKIILTLQVCEEWVLRIVPMRVTLERVAAQGASGAEGVGRNHALPALRMRHDSVTNLGECWSGRMPDAAGNKHCPRLKVQVEARGMGIATSFVAEMCPGIGLVGALVVREAYIAMDAKQ